MSAQTRRTSAFRSIRAFAERRLRRDKPWWWTTSKSDPRYLACSIETRSEIVVPVIVKGKVVGELDIDSHTPAAFGEEERKLVEHCAGLVGSYLEKIS